MVAFPNGKINLGLHVTGKREDGFHEIETLFYPIALHDVLEIIPHNELSFSSAGIAINGPSENNLCLKAFHLLKKDFPSMPEVSMFLYKNIPVGAGLGGGSADAVTCLQLLNTIGDLHLPPRAISDYALKLGSDCPFFVINRPCFATGRGEILKEMHIDLSAYKILIVNPGIHVNTGWAFSSLKTFSPAQQLENIISQPVQNWKEILHNDFECVVNIKHPETARLKDLMYEKGAVYASLSGTGSTVYGLFKKSDKPDIHIPETYFFKWL
jgi:4-diphosphocytidyl-2-C-methyl-D-erythritol kinase